MCSTEKIKIGIIIPTRGDRPGFLDNCLRLLKNQTVQPDIIKVMDYAPESEMPDITQRYRRGYEEIGDKVDYIFFWEDDDYYSPDFIETMLSEWNDSGRPDLFGTNQTIYYHIKRFEHFTMFHDDRCSAMSTMIKANLNFNWPPDYEVYTDTHIWMAATDSTGQRLNGKVFEPKKIICLGIKHGVGKTGGSYHINRLQFYTDERGTNDLSKEFLKSVCDQESFQFYTEYFIDR